MTANSKSTLIGLIGCLGFIIGWTIGPIYIKLLTGYLDVWSQNLIRYSVACLFWLPFLFYKIHRKELPAKLWKYAIPVTLVNLLAQSTWAGSFYFSLPAFLVILSKSCILFVAGLSVILFPDERRLLQTPLFWIGIAAAFAGTFGIVYYHADSAGEGLLWGTILALSHSFSFAVYTVLVKMYFKGIDPRVSFSVITLYTVPGLFLLALLFGSPAELAHLSLQPWTYIIISAVVSIALSHVAFYIAVQKIGVNIPSVLLLVIPLTVGIASFFLFHERMTVLQWCSGMVLLGGLGCAIRAQQRIQKRQNSTE
jgi:drug/metabolite transporter (DMT)-like permease